jgi:hypothetical protein
MTWVGTCSIKHVEAVYYKSVLEALLQHLHATL